MQVVVLKAYKIRETKKYAHPGDILDYPEERAKELMAGGWVSDQLPLSKTEDVQLSKGEKGDGNTAQPENNEQPIPKKNEHAGPRGRKPRK